MKRLALVWMSGFVLAASFHGEAQAVCARVTVRASYETATPKITLADLLIADRCLPLQEAAARVSLGATPRLGSVRVLEGSQIRRLLEELGVENRELKKTMVLEVPERTVVRRSEAIRSCAKIAQLLARAAPVGAITSERGLGEEDLQCPAIRGIAAGSALELAKTTWNIRLRRWEFALRCIHPEQCVPFLVWTRGQPWLAARDSAARSAAFGQRSLQPESLQKIQESSKVQANGSERLVKLGQTATLTWEHSGLRIMLLVTCLDAGGMGEFVRVRFKNTPRIMRAVVVGQATLRAQL
jgi:hypothetical protein